MGGGEEHFCSAATATHCEQSIDQTIIQDLTLHIHDHPCTLLSVFYMFRTTLNTTAHHQCMQPVLIYASYTTWLDILGEAIHLSSEDLTFGAADGLNMQNERSQHSMTRNLRAHNLSLHSCQVLMLTQFLALIISQGLRFQISPAPKKDKKRSDESFEKLPEKEPSQKTRLT